MTHVPTGPSAARTDAAVVGDGGMAAPHSHERVNPARTRSASSWVGVTAFSLSVIGVGLSTYMTIAHYTEAAILACSGSGELSCTLVTTSPESTFLGVPVALLGMGYFVVMGALTSPPLWRRDERWLARTRSALAVGAVLFVLWLVAAEVLIIGHVCLWCTGVHVVALSILLVLTRAQPAQLGLRVDAND